jgi:Fur family peroxide stress response transcriptional regulator
MGVPKAEADRRLESLTQALREAGLRITHQRLEVAREIAASEEHPDVESIYTGVLARVPTISLDTVYRTLATLVDRGLIVRVGATAGPARYDANMSHHHHFVCTRCGMMRDVSDPELDAVAAPGSVAALGHVESVDVQLRGVCAACARQEGDRPKGAGS